MKKRFRNKNKTVAPTEQPTANKMAIRRTTIAKSAGVEQTEFLKITPYEPPPGVIPAANKNSAMAMDETPYEFLNQQNLFSAGFVQYHFPGYPVLAMYSQFPEYRKMSETIAKEMTRKWIRITAVSDSESEKKSNVARVAELEKAMQDYCVQDRFRRCAELDGFFGRGQLYIDVKMPSGVIAYADPAELKMPLILDPKKITKGSLIGFNVIEPVWTYPSQYNSNNPLAPDYYNPLQWYVMGKTIDGSRLLMFRSREVPDLLKSAYNFGGLSMSQMAKPYVDNWLRTRESVGDMVHSYSVTGVKTDMSSVLSGTDDAQFFLRAELFNNLRDNRGLMLLDKEAEEFFQFNTPLSGLDKLQAQAQEQMSSVSNIPLVKLLGITPSGLNASSDGEIRVFYDFIHSMQEHMFTDNIKTVMEIIMLSLWGEIDPDISFEFEPLWSMDDTEKAQVRKTDAEADNILIAAGVISNMEARQRIAADPDSGYNGIDVEDDSELVDGNEDDTNQNDDPEPKDET